MFLLANFLEEFYKYKIWFFPFFVSFRNSTLLVMLLFDNVFFLYRFECNNWIGNCMFLFGVYWKFSQCIYMRTRRLVYYVCYWQLTFLFYGQVLHASLEAKFFGVRKKCTITSNRFLDKPDDINFRHLLIGPVPKYPYCIGFKWFSQTRSRHLGFQIGVRLRFLASTHRSCSRNTHVTLILVDSFWSVKRGNVSWNLERKKVKERAYKNWTKNEV